MELDQRKGGTEGKWQSEGQNWSSRSTGQSPSRRVSDGGTRGQDKGQSRAELVRPPEKERKCFC